MDVPPTSAEQELMLLLARPSQRRRGAGERIRRLAEQADQAAFAEQLERRRLLPLLGGRLIEEFPEHVGPEFRELVGAATLRSWATGIELQDAGASVVETLARQGIRALGLKGPRLAVRAHGDLALRSAGDVDLLVSERDLRPAAEVLMQLGYQAPRDPIYRDGLPDLHLGLGHPERPTVELHWRVHWHERTGFSPGLLDRAVETADGLVPTMADDAAALLLFYARDGFSGLRLLCDITGWWDRQAADATGAMLDDHARRHPELARSWLAAALTIERFGEIPACAWLTPPQLPDRRASIATRLASWSQRGASDQLPANIVLVDALLAPPRSAVRLVERQLNADVARPVVHVMKFAARFVIALWQTRRRNFDPLP